MILWIEIGIAALALGIAIWAWRNARSTQRKIRYVFDATLSNDFAYHFSEDDPRGVNATLNKIVAHLQALTDKARTADAYYGLILDQAVTGIVIIDDADNVTHVNQAALRLLNLQVLTHLSQLQRNVPTLHSALSMRINSCTVGDRVLTLAVTDTTLAGEHLRILAINDISQPMQSKEDESWVKLTRVLTHEIMNSLTPVNSITETLREKARDISPAALEESLDTISACNRSLMNFVESFRKFSLIPSPKPTAFELLPFLQGVVELGREMGPTVSFSLTVEPSDIMLYADKGMLHQVMVNLTKNAIEARPESVQLSARVNSDESVQIDIANDGEVIPEEIAEHIFVPFFTTRAAGSGIGLSLSRRYICANNGSLSLERLPKTKFTIKL